ncbi:MAG: hypothetical protein IPP31_03995 [Chitinophagaceae bacterium]|nr:hypothetical protein [Chitinophagaceae bacterium]
MSQIIDKDLKVDLQLKAIELLKGTINLPFETGVSFTSFSFNINIESKADAGNKLIFVIVDIEIKSENHKLILGSCGSCIYSVHNFDEVITTETDGKIVIPKALVEILNSISLSTTRGIMFSTFKGTFLHNAFLPIVDPRTFVAEK